MIFPFVVVVASATEFVIDPVASASAFATYSVVANLVLLSFKFCVTAVAPVGNTTSPVNVGDAKFAFRSSAVCCAVLTGLFTSEELLIFPRPKLILALLASIAPVPPLATATMPETLVALPMSEPVTIPVRLPVIFPVTFPIKFEVMLFAIKLPDASLFIRVLAVFCAVAVFAKMAAPAISSLLIPPILITTGIDAVPPKSPANKILPLLVVVASATEFVIVPEASAIAFATYAVVANLVLLSFKACVTPVVPVGNTTSPVNVGEAKFAFKSSAFCCATLTGLLISEVLSTLPSPKFVFADVAELAPVPPLTNATTPFTFDALPVTVPVRFPVIFPITFPVTFPIKLPLKVFAEIVLPEKSPTGLLLTI